MKPDTNWTTSFVTAVLKIPHLMTCKKGSRCDQLYKTDLRLCSSIFQVLLATFSDLHNKIATRTTRSPDNNRININNNKLECLLHKKVLSRESTGKVNQWRLKMLLRFRFKITGNYQLKFRMVVGSLRILCMPSK